MPVNRMVGEAYILMRADGTLIPRDVKNVGKKAAKAYRKEFDKELTAAEKGSIARFRRSLAQATVDIDFSRFRKEFGSIDDTVAGVKAQLKKMRAESLITAKSAKRVGNELRAWAKEARIAEGIQLQTKAIDDQNRAWVTYGRNVEHTLTRQQRLIDDQNRAWLTYGKNVEHTLTREERAREEQNRAWLTYGRNLLAANRAVEVHTKKVATASQEIQIHSSKWVNGFRRIRLGLDRSTDRVDEFGTVVGRVFGKGSRNNFVNWVGSMVGGLTRLSIGIFTFPARAVAHIGDTFGTAFSASRAAGLGVFRSGLKGIGAVLGGKGGLLGLAVGAGAGVFALGKLLPGIVSLLTQLGGVVTALAGSIGIGLTGALLAATPAAIGAAAAFGGVFGVITAFAQDKDNKKFWESVFEKPVKRLSKELYPQIKTFLTGIRSGFQTLLDDLRPGIETFFSSWQKKMGDKTTLSALNLWSDSLGRMSKTLNSAVTSFASGLVGFFTPILPYAERFTKWIERGAKAFDEWANSTPGKNSIAAFMKNAWENAKLVWDILKEIGSIFGTVFSSGDENAGQSFLEGIRSKLQEIDAYLKTDAGRSKLDNFFGDVKEIGEGIGALALAVGDIVKKLNDPEARASAKQLMDAFVGIANVASQLASVAEEVGKIIGFMTAPVTMAALELIAGIRGVNKDLGTPPPPKPGNGGNIDFTTSINGTPFKGSLETGVATNLGLTVGQKKQLATYVVDTDLTTATYERTKKIVEDFRFRGKQVPVAGNEVAWNATKGTIAGYAFKTKVVPIEVADKEVTDWIAWWNRKNLNKTVKIRYSVGGDRLPNGGKSYGGGIPVTARGGTFYGDQVRRIAEAGPEAVVPLRRPLHLVDPSVRALSAIAQGLKPPAMAAGGIVSGGGAPTIIVPEGAVQVQTAATDPTVVGRVVLNGLGDALAAAI